MFCAARSLRANHGSRFVLYIMNEFAVNLSDADSVEVRVRGGTVGDFFLAGSNFNKFTFSTVNSKGSIFHSLCYTLRCQAEPLEAQDTKDVPTLNLITLGSRRYGRRKVATSCLVTASDAQSTKAT